MSRERSLWAWLMFAAGVGCYLALFGYNTTQNLQPVFEPLSADAAGQYTFEVQRGGSYDVALQFRAAQGEPGWWEIINTDGLAPIRCEWRVEGGTDLIASGNFRHASFTELRLTKLDRLINRVVGLGRAISLVDEIAVRGGGKFTARNNETLTVTATWVDGGLKASRFSPHLSVQLNRRALADAQRFSIGVLWLSALLISSGFVWLFLLWLRGRSKRTQPVN